MTNASTEPEALQAATDAIQHNQGDISQAEMHKLLTDVEDFTLREVEGLAERMEQTA